MRRVIIGLLAVLAVLGVLLWLNATAIAERGLTYMLGKREIPVQSYRIVSMARERIVLADVVMGRDGEVKAAQAELLLGWKDTRRLERLEVRLQGVDLTASMGEGGMALGGVEHAWGPVVTPDADAIEVWLIGDMDATYDFAGPLTLRLPGTMLHLRREGEALLPPLALDATAEGDLRGSIRYRGTAADAGKHLQASFDGSYDLAAQAGRTAWSLKPVRFTEKGFSFAQLSPHYAAEWPTFPMQVSAKGDFALQANGWQLTPTVTFHELPLDALADSLLGGDAVVKGSIAGGIPLTVTSEGWRIRPATLRNKGGLSIAVAPVGTTAQMLQTHPQSQLVLSALSNLQVDTMTLGARSTDDKGGLSLNWHFLGANPELFGGKKVDFTLAVNANLEDIWLSATQAEKLAEKAQQAATAKGTKP